MAESASLSPIKIRYYGDKGPAITVLHGGPGAIGSAEGLARALSKYCRVSEPLQRESGEIPLTVESHVRDLLEICSEGEILIGHSWGAMLALSFASIYSEMVSNIILIGCGTYNQDCRSIMKKRLDKLIDNNTHKKIMELKTQYSNSNNISERDAISEKLGRIFMDIECYEADKQYSYHSGYNRIDSVGYEETWNDVLRIQKEGIEPARFKNIKCPVLMIHGDNDPHPGRETADLLVKYIPRLEYREIKRCGHEPWREKYGLKPMLDHILKWIIPY